ncbi:MAG: choice-of-anchor J domain-containing protein [Saprospirales bacterium]|nr:choice-of-anchor J domain-containing protein [Saprospirales bacterium]
MYPGSDLVIQDPLIIEGVVVADDSSGNFYRALIVQDATAGIEVRFAGTDLYNDYPMGRKVFVNCQGLTLSNYNGVLQLGEIQAALIDDYICRGAKNQVVEPVVVTIDQLNASYIDRLVRLEGVQFDAGSAGVTYADGVNFLSVNLTLMECASDATIILRSSGYADFATKLTPTGSGYVDAIYSVYQSDKQLLIRHERDVQMDNARCESLLNESFTGVPTNQDLNLPGWTNIAVKGTRLWRGASFSGNFYAQATAYQDTNNEMETWLITPPINLDNPKTLSFESAMAFFNHDGLTALISTDFSGNVATATWTPLSCNLAGSGNANYDWVASGPIDLSGFSGTGHVAFRYIGNKTSQTTTFQLDNIRIVE